MRALGNRWVARYGVELLHSESESPVDELFGSRFPLALARLAGASWLEPRSWGSAYLENPWPPHLPMLLPDSVTVELQERFSRQQPGRVARCTWPVRGAPAELTLEDHEDALVLAVRSTADLAPAPLLMELGEQASAVGVRLHSEAELAATLQALQAVGLELSEAQLQTLRSTLVSLSAVWHSDLRLLACLRTLRGLPVGEQRPALREAIIAAATRAGYRLFLHELLAIEPTPLLRRLLQSLTAFPAEAD